MLIKKFKSASMQEALKMVKAEFGLDAMILNTREERPRGIKRLFRKPFYEVTATMAAPKQGHDEIVKPAGELRQNTREEFRNSMLEPLAREIKMLKDRVETLYERESSAERSDSRLREDFVDEPDFVRQSDAVAAPRPDRFENLLMGASGMNGSLPARSDESPTGKLGKGGSGDSRDEFLAFAEELRQNGVDTEVAETLVERIIPFVGRKRKADALRKGLRQALESLADFENVGKRPERRVIALMGPAGVGKTTTIAKIAAAAAEQGKRVAVVTADSIKADAAKKLKRYAGETEIVVNTASTPQKLAKAMESNRGKDIVLVDTAGISPDDHEAMEELQRLLEACPGVEKHLCLSSTTRDRELDDIVKRFERYAIDRLIFTRLDESRTFGSIINCLLRSNLTLSYLTSGQQVTGNIEIATADRLSELATGGNGQ